MFFSNECVVKSQNKAGFPNHFFCHLSRVAAALGLLTSFVLLSTVQCLTPKPARSETTFFFTAKMQSSSYNT